MIKNNKWKIAIAAVIVIGITVCVKSCADRREADLRMAYIGYGFVNMEKFEGAEGLFEAVGDVNGDGAAICEMVEISFNETLSSADFANSQQKLMNAVGNGNSRVYIINKKFLDANLENDVFADISFFARPSDKEVTDAEDKTIAISLEGNEKIKELGIDQNEELYIAVRKVSEMDGVMYKNIEELDAAAQRAVQYILSL